MFSKKLKYISSYIKQGISHQINNKNLVFITFNYNLTIEKVESPNPNPVLIKVKFKIEKPEFGLMNVIMRSESFYQVQSDSLSPPKSIKYLPINSLHYEIIV